MDPTKISCFIKKMFSLNTRTTGACYISFYKLVCMLRECHNEKVRRQLSRVDVIAFCSFLSSLWTAVNFTSVLPAELFLFFLQHQIRKYERVAREICCDRFQQGRSGGSERVCWVPEFTSYSSYQTSFLTVWQGEFFVDNLWFKLTPTFIKRALKLCDLVILEKKLALKNCIISGWQKR